MKNFISTLLCVALCCAFVSAANAQSVLNTEIQRDINIARKIINDKRNTALALNMSFTEEEKNAFWPLYREYRQAMAEVGDRRLAIIVKYADNVDDMTDKLARELLDESIAVEKATLKVKERYIRKFRRILPETKVVRLMQLETRMDAMVYLKTAEEIPLMQ